MSNYLNIYFQWILRKDFARWSELNTKMNTKMCNIILVYYVRINLWVYFYIWKIQLNMYLNFFIFL